MGVQVQKSVEFCSHNFTVALIMTNQPTQGFPYWLCCIENISQNITHMLHIDIRIHSALYWLMPFYQPQTFQATRNESSWIIPWLLFPYLPMCRQLLPKTLQNTSHGAIHTALNSSFSAPLRTPLISPKIKILSL